MTRGVDWDVVGDAYGKREDAILKIKFRDLVVEAKSFINYIML